MASGLHCSHSDGADLVKCDLVEAAYVSAHVTPEGTRLVEICSREPISYVETKRQTVRPSLMPLLRLLDRALLRRLLVTDAFCGIRRVPAECRFFRYA